MPIYILKCLQKIERKNMNDFLFKIGVSIIPFFHDMTSVSIPPPSFNGNDFSTCVTCEAGRNKLELCIARDKSKSFCWCVLKA